MTWKLVGKFDVGSASEISACKSSRSRLELQDGATDFRACGTMFLVFTLIMKALRTFLHLACATILAGGLHAAVPTPHENHSTLLLAQSLSDHQGSVELEQFLFVQAPERDDGKGSIVVIWLPQPLQKLCLGKTGTQCSTIDYCIRTTNRESSQCRNVGVNLARIPPYPPETRPRRKISVVYFPSAPIKGFEQLKKFYENAPKVSLERISMSSRIKARIRFTRNTDDDDFDLMEVLAVPPF
jgi:hypothetical protein